MPTQIIKNIPDRDLIKSAVASGDPPAIQASIEHGHLKRKIHKVAEVDTDSSQITFVVSADNVDRDGERILPDALKKDFAYYESNPVALFNHDHSIPAVAKMVDYDFQDDKVVMTDQFATDIDYPFAKMLWELYAKGYMCMTSIGFIPLAATDDKEQKLEGQSGYTFTRIEMIEHSYVNVGANRHAISELPEKIRNDATLKSAYEEMVETSPVVTGIGDAGVLEGYQQTFADNKTSIHVPNELGGNSLVLNITIPEKEVTETMEKENRCPKCEESEEVSKSANLADALKTAIGDGDDRIEKMQAMADASGIEMPAIQQLLDEGSGDIEPKHLKDFAEALDIPVETLVSAAEKDEDEKDGGLFADTGMDTGVSAPETKAKASVVKKMYGTIPGTYEHRQDIIRRGLHDYLEENLEMEDADDDDYYYMDFNVIGTTEKDVVVYCWNTYEHYKLDYTLTDTTATFSNLMKVMPEVSYTPID